MPEGAANPGRLKSAAKPENHQLGGTRGECQKPQEDDDVQHAGQQIARMAPLASQTLMTAWMRSG